MMDKVYIVVGHTGIDSGHDCWDVVAYEDKDMADLHCAKANDWLRERGLHESQIIGDFVTDPKTGRKGWSPGTRRLPECAREINAGKLKIPFDGNIRVQNTGVWYEVEEVPFYLHLDQFIDAHP